jgi:hypothetical protein
VTEIKDEVRIWLRAGAKHSAELVGLPVSVSSM